MTWRHTAGGRAGLPALAAFLVALGVLCVCFAQPAHAETVTLGLGGWQVQSTALAAQAGRQRLRLEYGGRRRLRLLSSARRSLRASAWRVRPPRRATQ